MNPPTEPAKEAPARKDDLEAYHKVAETIGGVPSLRVKDHVIQGIAVVVGAVVGGVGGLLAASANKWAPAPAAMGGAVAGLIFGVLISGGVLMVQGMLRHKKH